MKIILKIIKQVRKNYSFFSSESNTLTQTINEWISHFCLFVSLLPGDKCHWAGLQAASSHGLSSSAAPADARLLAERQERAAQVHRYCQHAGQNDTQPRISESRHQQRRPGVSGDTKSFTHTNALPVSALRVGESDSGLSACICSPSHHPLLDRGAPDLSRVSSVEDWLVALKMTQYRDSFLDSGFTSLPLVTQITAEWVYPPTLLSFRLSARLSPPRRRLTLLTCQVGQLAECCSMFVLKNLPDRLHSILSSSFHHALKRHKHYYRSFTYLCQTNCDILQLL